MKQSLKFSFVLFVMAVFALAAVFFGGPRAMLAKDGGPLVDDPGTPSTDETPIPGEGTDPAEENVTQEQDVPVDPIGKLEQNGKDTIQIVVTQPQFTDATNASADGFLYAHVGTGAAGKIYGYKVDAITGGLTLLGGFPHNAGDSSTTAISESLLYDSTNGRLFALNNGTTKGVSIFDVNQNTGALTELPYSPITLPSGSYNCIDIHPDGSPLVAASTSNSEVASYNITGTSATAASGSPYDAEPSIFSCEFSHNGQYVYTGVFNVHGFSVNQSNGILTALSGTPYSAGNTPIAYATDEEGRLFLSNQSSGTVRAFSPAGGIPTERSNIVSSLTQAADGIVHPAGFYMVADPVGNQVGVYKIGGSGAATSLAAVSGQPFASGGAYTDVLALSRTGSYLFAGNGNDRNITTYKVDVSSGALENIGTSAANSLGSSGLITGMAFAPTETPTPNLRGYVYALQDVNSGDNWLYGFREDLNSGTLSPLVGFPIKTGGKGSANRLPEMMAYDSKNNRLYVINDNNGVDPRTVTVYAVNQGNGSLSPLPFSPITLPLGPTGLWYCLDVHPGGSPLIVANNDGNVVTYVIDSSSATAALGSPFSSGTFPYSCALSDDGGYFYTGGQSGTLFAGFSVSAILGVLTPLSGSPYDAGTFWPDGYSTDASGRLYMGVFNADILVYTTNNGVPTSVSGNPFASGLSNAVHSVLHPSGYLMMADRSANQVGSYSISGSGSGTTLSAVSGSPYKSGATLLSDTIILALNYNSELLYTANGKSRSITTYDVNSSTGQLHGVAIQPNGTVGSVGRITGMAYVDYIRANFTGAPTSGRVNHTVNFTNSSEGPYTSCLWKFGDGAESTNCSNPSHTYEKPGTFKVTLTVRSPNSNHTKTRVDYINVQGANVYVPLSVSNFCGGFPGQKEKEPNNAPSSANGPLCLFRTYKGSPDNDHPELESDWFYFNSDGGPFTVSVTHFLESNAQVVLYYLNSGNLVTFQGNQASANYILNHNGPSGKYLVRVVAGAGHPKDNGDYSLKVTKP